MKTTILLLSLFSGIISSMYSINLPKGFENRVIHKMVFGLNGCASTKPSLWDSELIAKADSSNQYIYIVGKHNFSDNIQTSDLNQPSERIFTGNMNVEKYLCFLWIENSVKEYSENKYFLTDILNQV